MNGKGRKNGRKGAKAERVKVEISAGGIVFKRTPRGVRVAFIMDPFAKWAFAKGHVEKGEAIVDAAVRETKEEMGLEDLRVVAPLGTIDFWFRDRYRAETKGVLVHKYVHYFLMRAPADAKGRPQKKEKIRRIIWTGLRRAMATSSYDDVRPILRKAIAQLSGRRRRGGGRPPTPPPAGAGTAPPKVVE
jgi:ADP-ribose pyrophosphatase YjhB (NUDIX family)